MTAAPVVKPDFPGHPVSDLSGFHPVRRAYDLFEAKAVEFAAENADLQNRLGVSAMLSEAAIETLKELEALLDESNRLLADIYPATAVGLANRATAALDEMRRAVFGPDFKN